MSTTSAGPPCKRPLFAVGVLAGALALAAACGSQTSSGSGSAAGGATGQASGTQVTATLTEYKIALSQSSFAPGTYTFVAKNSGSTTHGLEINGPGVADEHTADISPGGSAQVTVTLSAGSYEVFCPVDGHKDLGMDLHITVGGAGAGAPATSAQATTTAPAGGGGYGNGY